MAWIVPAVVSCEGSNRCGATRTNDSLKGVLGSGKLIKDDLSPDLQLIFSSSSVRTKQAPSPASTIVTLSFSQLVLRATNIYYHIHSLSYFLIGTFPPSLLAHGRLTVSLSYNHGVYHAKQPRSNPALVPLPRLRLCCPCQRRSAIQLHLPRQHNLQLQLQHSHCYWHPGF